MHDLQLDDVNATDENAAMVLLVDDQAMIGEAVRRGLANEENIDFHFCADPHQAIAQAIQIKPTVILQDLVMPGLDGLTLVREYRNNPATRDIPIIVLSTKEDPLIKSAAFAAGANDYLVKLPDTIELVARIRYHSRSYMTLLQRDEAYRALRVSQQQLLDTNLVLQRLMNSDGLTGLSNRRHFDEYLELEWRRAIREQTQLSLMMIDVDYFKAYNDNFGHLEGDEALPNTSPGGARLLAEKLRQTVAGMNIPHIAPSEGASLTVSIGLSTVVPQVGSHSRQVIQSADQGLYAAKHNGRNQVVVG
jgi:two-component system chemotaxis family response regulator WspR